jgi:2-amino-4-hydroxy-6-hydroxymethyldihydropteridine diphosphokinase
VRDFEWREGDLKKVYLALGSNLGDRASALHNAVEQMESPELRVLRTSGVYETEPRELVDQPWFLNQVVEAETSLFPRQLLMRLKRLEIALGRRPSVPKGPRAIDIDILLYGDAVVSTPDLAIPHLGLGERRFVLEPLAELAPDLRHPRTGKSIKEMLGPVAGQRVRRV